MKRLLLFACTLLCANVLWAQTTFWVDSLQYTVSSYSTTASVSGANTITTANIPSTVTYDERTYIVTSIEGSAFYNCSSLTSVVIPNSVTSIENYAFYNCSNLTSVTIGNSVTSIASSAFRYCSSLTTLNFNAINCDDFTYSLYHNIYPPFYNLPITIINIGDSVQKIPDYFAWNLDSLTSVTIGNSVTSIGYSAFNSCNNLISINIPNSVTSIENYAFSYCSNLTSVSLDLSSINNNLFPQSRLVQNITLGENVSSIYIGAFSDFHFLQNVTCLSTTPPTLADNTVFPYPFNASLQVPCGSLEAYSAPTSYWNVFFYGRISENGHQVEVSINNDTWGSVEVVSGCEIGTLTATANSGYEFLNWNDGNTENPRVVSISSDTTFTATFGIMTMYNGIIATICEEQTYTENGFNVSEAGTYTQTLTSYNGGDSIVTLTLNVNPIFNTELTATICEGNSYTENGFNVSEAGTYTQTLQTVNGCDSIVTLTLNVNPIFNTELTATICEGQSYTENGFNVSEAGTYTQTLQTINGCDSIVTLTLNVNPIFNTELTATICEGQVYTENGFNVNEAGTYTQNLQTINGCDSIVTLTLNVNPVYNTELTATICEGTSYTENGFNVTEAGTYTQSLQTINGCDSIVTLTLNVLPSYNTNLTATICEGSELSIGGFNVSEAGVYTQTHTAANGCDSIVTLTVTELPVYNTNLTLDICEGASMNFCGFNVTEGGVYTQTHTAVNGCDSIVTLTVTELPIIHTNLTLNICEGTTLNFSGFNVSEAGVYTQSLQTINGCDSVVTLTVTTYPTFDTTITATINAGETYTEFGFNESEAGTYVQNLQTEFGCDSTITLILDVNSSLIDVEEVELSFYPNPTQGKITFSSMIERIEVIDLSGKVVMNFENKSSINIDALPSGAYYLRLHQNDKAIMRKVIKE